MREKKKRISLLLGSLLLAAGLSGCKNETPSLGGGAFGSNTTEIAAEGEPSGGKGRFLESELTLPENVDKLWASALLENGNIEVFFWNKEEKNYQIQISEDGGETWMPVEIEQETSEELLDDCISSAAIKPDGTVAGIVTKSENDEICNSLVVISPDGAGERKELILPDLTEQKQEWAVHIIKSDFDAAGNFLIENLTSHFYKVDLSTGNCELLCDLEEKYSRSFGVVGNQVLAVSDDGIVLFDSINGTLLEEEAVLNDMITSDASFTNFGAELGGPLVFTGGSSGDLIFYVNHQGLFCHTRGGSISEQLINGALNSMGDITISFLDLMMVDEEHFLLTVMDGSGQAKLLQYTYDKDAPSIPETELKIYALEDSAFLRQAVAAYQKSNQQVYVNLQIGLSDDAVTAEDAIRALNTDILSGSGPDVLILDGLPADNYIEKGLLADISPMIQEIADTDGVFENVRQVYENDGAIYQFPAKFYVNLVNGDEEAVAAGASLKKLAEYVSEKKAAGESNIFPVRVAADLLEKLYFSDSACWLDESGKLKETEIKEYLTCAKQIYDAEPKEEVDVYYDAGIDGYLLGSLSVVGVVMKEAKIGYGTVVSTQELSMAFSANRQFGMDYALAEADTVKAFVPYQLAGMVNGTTEAEAAEKFLRVFFGMECGAVAYNGFPVNKAAYQKVFEEAKALHDEDGNAGIAVSTDDGAFFEMALENLTDEDVAKMTEILEEVEKPACMDYVIKEIVLKQGEKFLKGDLSVEEAVNEIVRKCNLYLAE